VAEFMLKSLKFKEENITFVPICGQEGLNVIEKFDDPKLAWYEGDCLLKTFD